MIEGTIKRLTDRTGIIETGDEVDIGFHRSAVGEVSFNDLQEGLRVAFTIGRGPEGPRAENIYVLRDSELLERFKPTVRDSDVFVVTTGKCGQTWLQALLFHLKSRGRAPDFHGRGIHGVSPWLEIPASFASGQLFSSREERLAQLEGLDDPRVFKMHVLWDEIPRPPGSKAQIITITRDPRDVPYSMFAQIHALAIKGDKRPPDDFDEYFERWMELGRYFKFVASFWPHYEDADLLWLRYEDMHRDLRGQTERILEFLGWDLSTDDIERALPLVDFQRMRSTEKAEIFREIPGVWRQNGRFFREGGVGKNRARLNQEQERRIVERLRAEVPGACAEFLLSLDA